jgi:hypothetical protein
MAKSDAGNAERAAEWYARERGCVVIVRAVRTQFNRQDLFGCDLLGKHESGWWYAIQVTTGKSCNVAQRRRKLEKIPWLPEDQVILLEMRRDTTGPKIRYYFRVHRLEFGEWSVDSDTCEVPRSWFKAYQREVER